MIVMEHQHLLAEDEGKVAEPEESVEEFEPSVGPDDVIRQTPVRILHQDGPAQSCYL